MVSDIRQGVVEYLLGELSPQEAQQFEASLRADPALRAEVERFRPVVGRLEGRSDDVWVPLEPPPIDIAGIVAAGPATANLDLAEGDGLRLRNMSGAASEPSGSSGSGSRRSLQAGAERPPDHAGREELHRTRALHPPPGRICGKAGRW